jgi:rhamnose utilization protein RhaD (predicted bifunctional aldolase and dehydrogenase)
MIDSDEVKNFIEVCASISRRGFFWIQSTGGNVSLKKDGKVFVKGSGLRLDQVQKNSQIAEMDADSFWASLKSFQITEQDYEKLLTNFQKQQNAKPSMESAFHVVLPFKWVVHFHSLSAIVLHSLVSQSLESFQSWYQQVWEEKLGKIRLVPYVTPGLELSKEIYFGSSAQVFFLKNHGVILASNSKPDLDLYEKFEVSCFEFLNFKKFFEVQSQLDQQNTLWSQDIYMPDLAVGLFKMQKFLEDKNGKTFLKEGADPNLVELFNAASFLDQFSGWVRPLSKDSVAKIVQLPTEKHRMKLLEK